MKIIKLISGEEFEADQNESILDAASKKGLFFAYGCKTGRCSACKCRVISGKSHAFADEFGLSKEEKSEGYILSCVRTAESDMSIEVDELIDRALPLVKTLPAKISSIEKLTRDVLRVNLRFPPNEKFLYLSGQYVNILNYNGIRRSYSIANAPTCDNQISFYIRAVDGGDMSEYWFHHAKINDLVRVSGPYGSFFMRSTENKKIVFMATGTGIAPIKAMIEELSSESYKVSPESISLYWGWRDLYNFYENPAEWFPGMRYIPVLSRPQNSWNGITGYVQNAFLNDGIDLQNCMVYACGSNSMIMSAKALLYSKGLTKKNFFSDAFVSSGQHIIC